MEIVVYKAVSLLAKIYSVIALPFLRPINKLLFGKDSSENIESDSTELIIGHLSVVIGAVKFSQSQVNDLTFNLIKAILVGIFATLIPLIVRHIFYKYIKNKI